MYLYLDYTSALNIDVLIFLILPEIKLSLTPTSMNSILWIFSWTYDDSVTIYWWRRCLKTHIAKPISRTHYNPLNWTAILHNTSLKQFHESITCHKVSILASYFSLHFSILASFSVIEESLLLLVMNIFLNFK